MYPDPIALGQQVEAVRTRAGGHSCEALELMVLALANELTTANALMRSTWQIALRRGIDTNWAGFLERVKTCVERQNVIMYPRG